MKILYKYNEEYYQILPHDIGEDKGWHNETSKPCNRLIPLNPGELGYCNAFPGLFSVSFDPFRVIGYFRRIENIYYDRHHQNEMLPNLISYLNEEYPLFIQIESDYIQYLQNITEFNIEPKKEAT